MSLKGLFTSGIGGLRELYSNTTTDSIVVMRNGEPFEIELGSVSPNGAITKAETGWAYYQDGTYTEGSPLAVNNARVALQNDGAGSNTNVAFLPESGALWDTVNDKILMPVAGSMFVIRVDWKAKAGSVNAYYDIQLDIGSGSPIIITQNTLRMVKGANTEQRFSQTISGFALSTFIANGCKIYFDSTDDGVNISVYDIAVHIQLARVP